MLSGIKVEFLNQDQVAELLQMSKENLHRMRREHKGPPFIRINGRTIRYHVKDLQEWLQKQVVIPSASAA